MSVVETAVREEVSARRGMTFEEGVRRLKALAVRAAQTAFEMGDVALDVVPLGVDHTNNGSGQTLVDLAEQAGIDANTLRERRFVASRVPDASREASVSWSAYREIANGVPDEAKRLLLFEKIRTTKPDTISGRWTVSAVRVLMGRQAIYHPAEPLDQHLANASPGQKVEVVKTLLTDQTVRDAFTKPGGSLAPEVEALAEEQEIRKTQADAPLYEAPSPATWDTEEENPTAAAFAGFGDRLKEAKKADVYAAYLRMEAVVRDFTAKHDPVDAAAVIRQKEGDETGVRLATNWTAQVAGWFRQVSEVLAGQGEPPRKLRVVGGD